MLPAAVVKVRGTPLAPELAAALVEVRVDSHLQLPDAAVVRLADHGVPAWVCGEVRLLAGSVAQSVERAGERAGGAVVRLVGAHPGW